MHINPDFLGITSMEAACSALAGHHQPALVYFLIFSARGFLADLAQCGKW
jgi:hypothetical protein